MNLSFPKQMTSYLKTCLAKTVKFRHLLVIKNLNYTKMFQQRPRNKLKQISNFYVDPWTILQN